MCPFSTHTNTDNTHTHLFQPVLKSVEIARIVGPYTIYVNIFISHSGTKRKTTAQNKRKKQHHERNAPSSQWSKCASWRQRVGEIEIER